MQTIETILNREPLTQQEAALALNRAVDQVRKNLERFRDRFPGACSEHGHYPVTENDDWTNGFYTGEIWLSYETTGEEKFREAALDQVDDFLSRMNRRIVVDHHDMGFLYSPSCVAAYQLTDSETGRQAALMAADNLMDRYQEKGGFFQAWGPVGKREEYRLIIDCLMNLPLLFWAAESSGKQEYRRKAEQHMETALRVLVREDFSTYHTYFFDPETGKPLQGATKQGNRNDSIWARGQAWAVYGTALSFAKTGKKQYREIFEQVTDCFLKHLPEDLIPYWDFDFQEDSQEPRDSSAAAIAACGMLEMAEHLEDAGKEKYAGLAARLLKALTEHCLYTQEQDTNGILLHATYSQGRYADGTLQPGADECTLWGDYFYMEALVRLQRDWKSYW